MAKEIPIKELEAGVQQFYERYSAKKLALAAFLVGVLTIGLTYISYALTTMGLVAIVVFGVAGLLSFYLMVIFVVPPSKKLAESSELICSAIREPSRIKSVGEKGVTLADKTGELHVLKGPDLDVWTSKVVPYLMEKQSAEQPMAVAKSVRKFSNSELKDLKDRRSELLDMEKRIKKEREELEKERKEIETRSTELRELEKSLSRKQAQVESESAPVPNADGESSPERTQE